MPRAPCSPLYVLPGHHPGLLVRGNIDICNRPKVWDVQARAFSSVRSASFEINGREVLLPTVIGNRIVRNDNQVKAHYRRTGKHLGIFDNAAHADRYANKLHLQQERIFG